MPEWISDEEAREAIETLAQFCSQHTPIECNNGECPLKMICTNFVVDFSNPGEWIDYLGGAND